jgi:hypothetical protein
VTRASVLALGLVLLAGCAWLEPRDDQAAASSQPSEDLPVVRDDEPFDPSKVVDDAQEGELQESEETPGEVQTKEEEVATEAEAEAREERKERAVEAVNELDVEDDEAKVELASNPRARDPGSGEPWTATARDAAMELVLVLALSLVLALPTWLILRAVR